MKARLIPDGMTVLPVLPAGTVLAASGDAEQPAGKPDPQTQPMPRQPDEPVIANDKPVCTMPVHVPPMRGARLSNLI